MDKKPSANEDAEEPVDAPAGYAPRVVKTPMHKYADVNHETARKQEHHMSKKPEPNVKKLMKGVDAISGATPATNSPSASLPPISTRLKDFSVQAAGARQTGAASVPAGQSAKPPAPSAPPAAPVVASKSLTKGAGWNAKDERQYNHIKDSGASKKIAAATVNKQRSKEGRLLHPNVKKGLIANTDKDVQSPGVATGYEDQPQPARGPNVSTNVATPAMQEHGFNSPTGSDPHAGPNPTTHGFGNSPGVPSAAMQSRLDPAKPIGLDIGHATAQAQKPVGLDIGRATAAPIQATAMNINPKPSGGTAVAIEEHAKR